MNKEDKLKLCRDCENDFYNHGNNSCSGECWSLDSATPKTVYVVGTWTENPDKNCWLLKRLSCWRPRRGAGISMWRKPNAE